MINWIHGKLRRPDAGWDPIPIRHAQEYSAHEWHHVDASPLIELEEWVGSFAGKEVLDLGAGPGQFTTLLAKKGARVTWHDVSMNYKRIAEEGGRGLGIRYSLGYLEDALLLGEERFDLVFNRICWNYCRSDRQFARLIWRLLRPGGVGYIDTTISGFGADSLTSAAKVRDWLNARLWWKIGHPNPPRGRVAELILRMPVESLMTDHSRTWNDRVVFRKANCVS